MKRQGHVGHGKYNLKYLPKVHFLPLGYLYSISVQTS